MKDIEKKVISLVAKCCNINKEELKMSAKLKDDLNCDSIEMVSLVIEIESEFIVEYPEDKLNQLSETTISQLIQNIKDIVG